MDLEYLKTLLPDAGEEPLTALLTRHRQELTTLTDANAQLTRELSQTRYDFALERETATLPFSSNAARSAFLAAARAQNLPLEDGHLQGFSDFRQRFEEQDPGAFRTGPVVVKDTGAAGAGTAAGSALRRAFGLK